MYACLILLTQNVFENSFFLASVQELYSSTINKNDKPFNNIHTLIWNLSKLLWQLYDSTVSDGKEFHNVQANFLPFPTNPDMVSQSVSVWSKWLIYTQINCYLKGCQISKVFFLDPNTIQNLFFPCSVALTITTNTTMSASTLRTKYDYGHAVQHVQHATSCDCQPLYESTEQ